MEEIIQLDYDVFLYLNNLGTENWDRFWEIITAPKTWIPLYLILALILWKTLGFKKTILTLLLVGLMILCTDQISNVFKNGVQRLRPCFTEELQGLFRGVICKGRGRYGFFSAHAANHFGLAVFLGMLLKNHYKYLLPVLIFWALMVAYSRIYLGVHFPLDILCGGLTGIFFGALFNQINNSLQKRFPKTFE